jgi:hypothetical protein
MMSVHNVADFTIVIFPTHDVNERRAAILFCDSWVRARGCENVDVRAEIRGGLTTVTMVLLGD